MDTENMKAFISDVVTELDKRQEEAMADMKAAPGDTFASGRALAYQEIAEIVKTRMDVYRIDDENAEKTA